MSKDAFVFMESVMPAEAVRECNAEADRLIAEDNASVPSASGQGEEREIITRLIGVLVPFAGNRSSDPASKPLTSLQRLAWNEIDRASDWYNHQSATPALEKGKKNYSCFECTKLIRCPSPSKGMPDDGSTPPCFEIKSAPKKEEGS